MTARSQVLVSFHRTPTYNKTIAQKSFVVAEQHLDISVDTSKSYLSLLSVLCLPPLHAVPYLSFDTQCLSGFPDPTPILRKYTKHHNYMLKRKATNM
ncbi:hypothetical protein FKM82_023478 [Ascaphus truei]